ncbi:MAG: gamma-glutamyl-gamma-aminobutyrate hydrolase family protein, partial [Alphaproteobacteria bacterium]|nr:gamma-glutamyl-gamma-aminobutyrate hydrolase family protein [Alphaproteobacteria bacterium]
MGSGYHSVFIKRDARFDHLPNAAQPPRVLLVMTAWHAKPENIWRIDTYVDALAQYSVAAVDILAPSQEFLDQFPKANNQARHDFSKLLKDYDGIVLSGGHPNVAPEFYGEAPEFDNSDHELPRDLLSIGLVQQAPSFMPILGICLGMQHVAVAHGAKLKKIMDHGKHGDDPYAPAHDLKIKSG